MVDSGNFQFARLRGRPSQPGIPFLGLHYLQYCQKGKTICHTKDSSYHLKSHISDILERVDEIEEKNYFEVEEKEQIAPVTGKGALYILNMLISPHGIPNSGYMVSGWDVNLVLENVSIIDCACLAKMDDTPSETEAQDEITLEGICTELENYIGTLTLDNDIDMGLMITVNPINLACA